MTALPGLPASIDMMRLVDIISDACRSHSLQGLHVLRAYERWDDKSYHGVRLVLGRTIAGQTNEDFHVDVQPSGKP
jgi:hypothetical protein